jgi:two-component system sensor histidine kinase KdpD
MEAEERAWESRALYRISDAMTRSILPEEILQKLPERIVEIVGAPSCAIYLSEAPATLRLAAAASAGGVAPPSAIIPAGAIHALLGGEPVKAAGLFVPLRVGARTVGVLQVELGESGARSDATERLMETLAMHIAAVIDRARLWREAADAELLRKTSEVKSALISAVSHDLRTPLFSIRLAATSLLTPDIAHDARARRDLLRSIDGEAERLGRLVANLLDLSRIEAGVLRPDKAWHHLGEVITRAADRLSVGAEGCPVATDIAPDLPLVSLDFTQIEDVLSNLLDNARRHSPPGGTIRISARRQGAEVVVRVENEGPPIPAAAAESIFDRFYTLPGSGGSSGLGLAICKGLVEAHGGRIWVERPGEPGARLAFALPVTTVPGTVGERPAARAE